MPEGSANHVLDSEFLPVGEFDLCLRFLLADAWLLTADRARVFRARARGVAAHGTRLFRLLYTLAWVIAALRARLRLQRLTVPLKIAEVQIWFFHSR